MRRWQEFVLIAQGWWRHLAAIAAIIAGLVVYELVTRPWRVRLEHTGLVVRPIAVDTAGQCRLEYWQQELRLAR